MAELKVDGLAMIAHRDPMHQSLNGTLCKLLEYCKYDPDCREDVWSVEFLGQPKASDDGKAYTWGWIQARYLIPLDDIDFSVEEKQDQLECV